MEYEEHLRNTLEKVWRQTYYSYNADDDRNDHGGVKDCDVCRFQGMDAESYSLHTFEALLTQSMENLGMLPP